MNITRKAQEGAIQVSTVVIILLSVLLAAASGLAIWSYLEYRDARTDVDGQIEVAVVKAEKEQAERDALKFAEEEKQPNRKFIGPDDYGRVTFMYPKTWSVYVESAADEGKGTYTAYLNPVVVPPVKDRDSRFALRVTIEDGAYESVLDSEYSRLVENGDLKSSEATANGMSGTRLDGQLEREIRGAAVVYKIRDKTLTIRTDAETFKPDFNEIVKTIEFTS
jgi:hypothetical protein